MSRREALSTTGKIAVTAVVAGVIAGVGGYLAGSTATPAAPKTVTETVKVTQTVPTTVTVTVGAPTTQTTGYRYITKHAQKPATTLIMNGWGYRPDIVKENIRIFNEQLNENAEYEVISGDYPAIMESKFIAGAKVDVCYGNPFHGARWYARGWIRSLTKIVSERYGLDLYKKIVSDIYPSVADGFTTTDGHLFALPYFTSARGNILYNHLLTQKAGIDEPPSSWWDLYEKIEIVKNKGVADTPFIPHWFKGMVRDGMGMALRNNE